MMIEKIIQRGRLHFSVGSTGGKRNWGVPQQVVNDAEICIADCGFLERQRAILTIGNRDSSRLRRSHQLNGIQANKKVVTKNVNWVISVTVLSTTSGVSLTPDFEKVFQNGCVY